jgi:hypothetical protein
VEPLTDPQVVIIGGGPSGLAAAMDLPGAILLEGSPQLGGRAPGAGSLMLFVGTPEQQEIGVHDSVDDALEDWPWLTGASPTPTTQAFLTDSAAVRDRLADLGLSWQMAPPSVTGTQRLHGAREPGLGVVLADGLPSDVDVRLGVWAEGLVIEDGRVTGVLTSEGTVAADVVVIASGGFSNNVELVSQFVGWQEGTWRIGGDEGAWGDALEWALEHDLSVADVDAMGAFSDQLGIQGSDGHAVALLRDGPPPWVWVNQDAERFVEEDQNWSVHLACAMHSQDQVWALASRESMEARLDEADAWALDELTCARRWDDVAVEIGLDPGDLMDTLNHMGRLDRFDMGGTPCAFPPGLSSQKSFGGLLVDEQQRVVDGRGAPVGGLYAVGEAAGMAQPGMGGQHGFDGSVSAVVWSGWRAAQAISGE